MSGRTPPSGRGPDPYEQAADRLGARRDVRDPADPAAADRIAAFDQASRLPSVHRRGLLLVLIVVAVVAVIHVRSGPGALAPVGCSGPSLVLAPSKVAAGQPFQVRISAPRGERLRVMADASRLISSGGRLVATSAAGQSATILVPDFTMTSCGEVVVIPQMTGSGDHHLALFKLGPGQPERLADATLRVTG